MKKYSLFILLLLFVPIVNAAWYDDVTAGYEFNSGGFDVLEVNNLTATSAAGISALSKLGNGSFYETAAGDYSKLSTSGIFSTGCAQCNFSSSFWWNTTSPATPQLMWDYDYTGGNDRGVTVLTLSATQIRFSLYGRVNDYTVTAFTANTWYHIATIKAGSNYQLWINGVNVANKTLSNVPLHNSTGRLRVGSDGANYLRGHIDSLMLFDRALTAAEVLELYNSSSGAEYPTSFPPASTPYAHVQVKDEFNNNTISGLTVYLGTLSNTTDGSGIAYFYNTSSTNYTIDGGANYFNASGTATQNSTTTAYVYGAYVALKAYNILGEELSTFNVSSGAYYNTTTNGTAYLLLSPNTTHNIVFNSSTYIPYTQSITTHGRDTDTYNTSGLYQTVINITGKSRVDNTTITGFTLNYTGYDGGVINGSATTTGVNITLHNMLGNYSLIFNNESFELGYYNFTAVSSAEAYQFYLYTTNSVNFCFYDEETGALLDNTTVYLEMISTAQAGNYSTTTGCIYEDLLSPDTYTLRYTALGYMQSFYYLTLTDRTFNALNLTLLNDTSGTEVTLNVYDTLGNKLEGATVKILKYDVTTNTYPIVEILNTNFEGVAVGNIVLNSEYYKFVIDYEGETRLTTTPTYIYGTSLNFYIPTGNSGMEDYFSEADISGTLSFNYDTNLATFTYSDLDNSATRGCLYAYTSNLGVNTLVNTSCSTSSSGSLNLFIFNTSSTWYLEGVVTKGGEAHTISTYRVDFILKLNENGSGAFFAFIILGTIVFISLFSLEIAVVLASAVPLFFSITRLADFDYIISIPILLLGLVTAFIIGSNKK